MSFGFPVPGTSPAAVAAPAPGAGFGSWAGAPSAALDTDLTFVIAYRLRSPRERGAEVVLARSDDGERLETVARMDKSQFGAESLERPALLRTSERRWRLYVSCATPGSKHWWIAVLEADAPECLAGCDARVAFAGDGQTGVKDPVIQQGAGGWRAWICVHPLEEKGEEDRMSTAYATSEDGLQWRWHGVVLAGRPGMWDARGVRVTSVLSDGRASYDGRASKEENFFERTGLARWDEDSGRLAALGMGPVSDARYLEVVPLPQGGYRLFYEAPLPDGSHELRTELVASGPDGAAGTARRPQPAQIRARDGGSGAAGRSSKRSASEHVSLVPRVSERRLRIVASHQRSNRYPVGEEYVPPLASPNG